MTKVNREDVSFCQSCYCSTHTIDGKCGKCGATKVNRDKKSITIKNGSKIDFDKTTKGIEKMVGVRPQCECSCHEFGDVVHGGVCQCGIKPESTIDAYNRRHPKVKIDQLDIVIMEAGHAGYDYGKSIFEIQDKINEIIRHLNSL